MKTTPLLLALALAAPAHADEGEWTGQVTPYLWGSALGGTLTPFTGAPTVSINKSLSEVLEDSDGAFFISGFARRDRLVLLADFSTSSSSKEGRVPPGVPAEGKLEQSSLTLAAGWRVMDEERFTIDLLAGLRRWDIDAQVDVPLMGVSRSPGLTFTDPLLAARANIALSPKWSLLGYVDAGIGGSGSDSTYQWLATLNYQPGERWVFSGGLRVLSLDYRDGGTRLDARLAGPLLGASWRF